MTIELRDKVQSVFDAVVRKDLETVLAALADDAVMFDPHYPHQRMQGKAAIRTGLEWGFAGMRTMSFTITGFTTSEDGRLAIIETATAHVLKAGLKLRFPQVFVIEFRDGLVTRLQAYEPYGPGGLVGLFLRITRLAWRLRGR